MDLNPVILAIPMYFTLMAAELAYEAITKRKTYRINDAVTNINTGVLQQLTNTFLALFKIGIYTFVYEYASIWELPQNVWTFLLAFLMWDLCYYWEHRLAHTVNLFWGGHVVHHQSEDFNLSVALRQTSTGFIWGFPFFLPMALLGIHPVQFVLVGGLNLLYQFWIHTEHIDRMPRWFEAVMNTPSHHRVHHGRDPKYIDKNYAGVFIIWDRMFGTFKKEEERPTYGITTPLNSWNPVYANFAHYVDLFRWSRQTRSVGDTFRLLFKPPGWFPEYMGGRQYAKAVEVDYQKFNAARNLGINLYILVQFLAALGFNSFYFFKNADLLLSSKLGFAFWIIGTALMFGLLFESKSRTLFWLEGIRLGSIPFLLFVLSLQGWAIPTWIYVVSVSLAILSWAVLWRLMFTAQKTPQDASISAT